MSRRGSNTSAKSEKIPKEKTTKSRNSGQSNTDPKKSSGKATDKAKKDTKNAPETTLARGEVDSRETDSKNYEKVELPASSKPTPTTEAVPAQTQSSGTEFNNNPTQYPPGLAPETKGTEIIELTTDEDEQPKKPAPSRKKIVKNESESEMLPDHNVTSDEENPS